MALLKRGWLAQQRALEYGIPLVVSKIILIEQFILIYRLTYVVTFSESFMRAPL